MDVASDSYYVSRGFEPHQWFPVFPFPRLETVSLIVKLLVGPGTNLSVVLIGIVWLFRVLADIMHCLERCQMSKRTKHTSNYCILHAFITRNQIHLTAKLKIFIRSFK